MKVKSLAILIVAALACGAAIYYQSKQTAKSSAPAGVGVKVLPDLPVNRVAKISITSREGAVTTIAKVNDRWKVASRFNYPANFDKVADVIRELGELKIGQTVNAGPSQLAALNLTAPSPGATNRHDGAGILIELRDEKDGYLASLLVGKEFMRKPREDAMEGMMGFGHHPSGQYIRTADNKVFLVSKSLARMTEDSKSWLADDFIDVPENTIMEISVSGPDRAAIKLARPKEGEALSLEGLRPEEGTLDAAKVSQLAGGLNRLGADDVVDPAISLKETGLDRGVTLKATTRDNLVYTLKVGNALTNDTLDRYFSISVTNGPAPARAEDPKPDQEAAAEGKAKQDDGKAASEKAAALNNTFGQWIYVMKSYRAEPLLITREDLVKKPQPPKEEEKQTGEPGDKAAEKTGPAQADEKAEKNK